MKCAPKLSTLRGLVTVGGGWGDGKATGCWARIPAALLTPSFTLHRLFHLTEPQFSHMWNGANDC